MAFSVTQLLGLTHKYCCICGTKINTCQKYCEEDGERVRKAQRIASRKNGNKRQ